MLRNHNVKDKCKDCEHWEQTTFYDYDGVVNDGKCKKIREKIDISIHYGWDGGYVNYLETEGDFGCNLFESKFTVFSDWFYKKKSQRER